MVKRLVVLCSHESRSGSTLEFVVRAVMLLMTVSLELIALLSPEDLMVGKSLPVELRQRIMMGPDSLASAPQEGESSDCCSSTGVGSSAAAGFALSGGGAGGVALS